MKALVAMFVGAFSAVTVVAEAGPIAVTDPIAFQFSGVITSVDFSTGDPFAGTILAGTTFSGTYTFDGLLSDGSTQPGVGFWSMNGPPVGSYGSPFGIQVNVGGNHIAAQDIFEIVVLNNFEVTNLGINDDYRVTGNGRDLFNDPNFTQTSIGIHLLDIDANVFANEDLPYLPPTLSDFEINEFTVRVGINGQSALEPGAPRFSGSLTTLTLSDPIEPPPTPVPEPSVLSLLGLGCAALGAASRQRSSGEQLNR